MHRYFTVQDIDPFYVRKFLHLLWQSVFLPPSPEAAVWFLQPQISFSHEKISGVNIYFLDSKFVQHNNFGILSLQFCALVVCYFLLTIPGLFLFLNLSAFSWTLIGFWF